MPVGFSQGGRDAEIDNLTHDEIGMYENAWKGLLANGISRN